MVDVRFRRDKEGRLSSVSASGHAGWADPGDDIVCAAVAALLQGAWLGLAEYAQIEVAAERSKGELALRWPKAERGRADVEAILSTAELSIAQIARQYADHVHCSREAETDDDAS
jgi:uncharacterized protein YsxB (DUF464 family)